MLMRIQRMVVARGPFRTLDYTDRLAGKFEDMLRPQT